MPEQRAIPLAESPACWVEADCDNWLPPVGCFSNASSKRTGQSALSASLDETWQPHHLCRRSLKRGIHRRQQTREHRVLRDVGRVSLRNSLKLALQIRSLLLPRHDRQLHVEFRYRRTYWLPCKANVHCRLNVKSAGGANAGRQITTIYDKRYSIDVARTVRYQKRDCMSDFIRGSESSHRDH
jgi:hypothetical protein